MMRAGPKLAIYGPNEPPPVKPGHRGQLARLIRERPVFVNVTGCRNISSLKRRNWGEYICFRGVFKGVKAARPGHRNRRTLAIGNLTGPRPTRILGIREHGSGTGAPR
jgi:hypothetical protein